MRFSALAYILFVFTALVFWPIYLALRNRRLCGSGNGNHPITTLGLVLSLATTITDRFLAQLSLPFALTLYAVAGFLILLGFHLPPLPPNQL